MNEPIQTTEIIFESELTNEGLIDTLNTEFREGEVFESSSFGGISLVSVIIAASTTAVQLIFKFYKEHKNSLKNAKIKIGKEQVSLEGFSAEEINDMAKKGTIQNILDKMK